MTLPNAPLSITDGGLGIVPTSSEKTHAIIGVCSSGTPNTLYSYSGDAKPMLADLVSGPAVEAAAVSLYTPGTGKVLVVPINASVVGEIDTGDLTYTRAAGTASTGVVNRSGAPKDDYRFVVTFPTGAATVAAGDATLKYSTDGGLTWSQVYALPTSGVFTFGDTGVVGTFSDGAGDFAHTGDTITWSNTAPSYTSGDLTAALDALLAQPDSWNFVHVVGRAASAADSATIAGLLAAKMDAAMTKIRYTFAIMEAAESSDADLKAAFLSFASTRVMVCAGDDEIVVSPITGRQSVRSTAWTTAARLGSIPISQSAAAVEDGPLKFVQKIGRDENATPGLDDARFCTHRTFTGRPGVYVGLDRLMAPAGSDYFFAPLRRVVDRACEVAHSAAVFFLVKKVRTNGKNAKPPLVKGAIAETDAIAIEKEIGNQLRDALITPGHATEASVSLSRTANLQSNGGSDPLTLRLVAFGYLLEIPIDIGLVNPATQG